jgi:DNA-binding beta-propeller fold protein YncE
VCGQCVVDEHGEHLSEVKKGEEATELLCGRLEAVVRDMDASAAFAVLSSSSKKLQGATKALRENYEATVGRIVAWECGQVDRHGVRARSSELQREAKVLHDRRLKDLIACEDCVVVSEGQLGAVVRCCESVLSRSGEGGVGGVGLSGLVSAHRTAVHGLGLRGSLSRIVVPPVDLCFDGGEDDEVEGSLSLGRLCLSSWSLDVAGFDVDVRWGCGVDGDAGSSFDVVCKSKADGSCVSWLDVHNLDVRVEGEGESDGVVVVGNVSKVGDGLFRCSGPFDCEGMVYAMNVHVSIGGEAVTGSPFMLHRKFRGKLKCGLSYGSDYRGVCVLGDGKHLVCTFWNGIEVFEASSTSPSGWVKVREFGYDGELASPSDVCGSGRVGVDGEETILVSDCGNRRVQELTLSGEYVRSIGVGVLQKPIGLCVHGGSGLLFVVEDEHHRVSVLRLKDGSLVRRFGSEGDGNGDGQLTEPCYVCLLGNGQHVAVTEWGNDRVSVFTLEGVFVRHVGVGMLSDPVAICAASIGGRECVIVGDQNTSAMVVFDVVTGEEVQRFDCQLNESGYLTTAAYHDGRLYVASVDDDNLIVWY